MTFTNELKRLKKVLLHAVSAGSSTASQDAKNANGQNDTQTVNNIEDQNIETIIRRLVKYKEDNKKLKSILK